MIKLSNDTLNSHMKNKNANFVLMGHDCPLGVYPSIVVPVGKGDHGLVVAYVGDDSVLLEEVDPNARYERHSDDTVRTLSGFDYAKHGLFALSANDIRIFAFDQIQAFFTDLLQSPEAEEIDIFYRFSLALVSKRKALIENAFARCVVRMRSECPEEIAEDWVRENERRISAIYDRKAENRRGSSESESHKFNPVPRTIPRSLISSMAVGLSERAAPSLWHLSSLVESEKVTESQLNRLLNEVYKFKRNHHNRGTNRSFVSWDWMYQDRILVRSVTRWSLSQSRVELPYGVADNLGLDPEELEAAIEGRYSRASLLLMLFVHQVHRHLGSKSWDRTVLLEHAGSFLSATIEANAGSESRSLLEKRRSKLEAIKAYSETRDIGRELLTLAV
jgi:hypothetical protein